MNQKRGVGVTVSICDFSSSDRCRALVLYGLNGATYKTALAKTLLELSKSQQTAIQWSDLSKRFFNQYRTRLDANGGMPQSGLAGRRRKNGRSSKGLLPAMPNGRHLQTWESLPTLRANLRQPLRHLRRCSDLHHHTSGKVAHDRSDNRPEFPLLAANRTTSHGQRLSLRGLNHARYTWVVASWVVGVQASAAPCLFAACVAACRSAAFASAAAVPALIASITSEMT